MKIVSISGQQRQNHIRRYQDKGKEDAIETSSLFSPTSAKIEDSSRDPQAEKMQWLVI
jgi:hypothetical protein